ncbi:hypothetical protein AB6A23_18625 [Paenibacillus tarimensis]
MEATMSVVDVISQLQKLKSSGETLNKKRCKQTHPNLVQNALFYFPSWEHALQSIE